MPPKRQAPLPNWKMWNIHRLQLIWYLTFFYRLLHFSDTHRQNGWRQVVGKVFEFSKVFCVEKITFWNLLKLCIFLLKKWIYIDTILSLSWCNIFYDNAVLCKHRCNVTLKADSQGKYSYIPFDLWTPMRYFPNYQKFTKNEYKLSNTCETEISISSCLMQINSTTPAFSSSYINSLNKI